MRKRPSPRVIVTLSWLLLVICSGIILLALYCIYELAGDIEEIEDDFKSQLDEFQEFSNSAWSSLIQAPFERSPRHLKTTYEPEEEKPEEGTSLLEITTLLPHIKTLRTFSGECIKSISHFLLKQKKAECRRIFDASCPAGPPGPPGVGGVDGLPGLDGEDGYDGLTGYQQSTGMIECFECPVGEIGPPGEDGPPGEAGRIVYGSPGLPGLPGDPGEPGSIGKPGAPGRVGDDGYRYLGFGVRGPPGLQGLPGSIGVSGRNGIPSSLKKGLPGLIGDQGVPGSDGIPGRMGKKGATGDPGTDGFYCECPARKKSAYRIPQREETEEEMEEFEDTLIKDHRLVELLKVWRNK